MINLVLVNSQQNFFDIQNRIAGWYDVGLTQNGIEQSKQIAQKIKNSNLKIDYAFLSVLLRAEQTYQTLAKELGYKIRSFKSYKLNQTCFGALQGMDTQTAKKTFGADVLSNLNNPQFVPPQLDASSPQNPNNDPLYAGLKESMPLAESYNQMAARAVNYVAYFVLKTVKAEQTALIVAHTNILKAIATALSNGKCSISNNKTDITVLQLTNEFNFQNCFNL